MHLPESAKTKVYAADCELTGTFLNPTASVPSTVQLLKVPEVGVPRTGVTSVGEVANTNAPEPVSPVTAEARLVELGVARNVATPAPRPLTPVLIGNPVALVSVPLVGVPSIGVTNVGEVANTREPVPVSSVTAVAKFAELGVARNVATPDPRPLTPVEIGNPVALVRVPLVGVPSKGVTSVGDVESTTLPVPVEPVTPVPPFATGRVPVTPVVKGNPVALVRTPLAGVPKAGVTSVGEVASTTAPVPVTVEKSVSPASQLAAVVPVIRIQVTIAVIPGSTVITRLPPDELTVKLPVLLLTI